MKNILLILTITIFTSYTLYAQYNDPYQYYPMATGNYWYYSAGPGSYYSEKIYADSVDSRGNRFFWHRTKYAGDSPTYGVDTKYFFIVTPTWGIDARYLYKLDAKEGDWWWVRRGDSSDTTVGTWCELTDIHDGTYLGIETRFKEYAFNIRVKENNKYYDYWDHDEILAYGIGLVYRDNDAYYPYNLLGAIIDGKTIGNPVDVKETTAEELPDNFELYQNYPNPFNPSTVISYDLVEMGFVSLDVYDVLGRKMKNLVNEVQNAGRHELTFKAGNLSSGIYLCCLKCSNKMKVIKMLLTK